MLKSHQIKFTVKKNASGFTLVEIIVAITVLAILAVVGFNFYYVPQQKARFTKAIADVAAIGKAYEVHYDVGTGYPPLSDTYFTQGHIPSPPSGEIEYTFVSGPDSPSAAVCNVVKICTPTSSGSSSCTDTSSTCYCYEGLQGPRSCLLAIGPGVGVGSGSGSGVGVGSGSGSGSGVGSGSGSGSGVGSGSGSGSGSGLGSGIGIGGSTPSPTPTSTPSLLTKRAFVTSSSYDGNLGGLSGADARCQASANSAGLGGSWRAWLSDSTGSPSSTFNSSATYRTNTIFQLLNGAVVANDWADLTDGSLQNAIFINENGSSEPTLAWTNTRTNGNLDHAEPTVGSCNNWTSNTLHFGAYGSSGLVSSGWTVNRTAPCADTKNLYCFEQ